jgi:hypothetical protein
LEEKREDDYDEDQVAEGKQKLILFLFILDTKGDETCQA